MRIAAIRPGSAASRLQLSPGDDLLAINGHCINDQLDYFYYSTDEELVLEVAREETTFIRRVRREYADDLGLEFEPMGIRCCGDDCVFCFVHQNPEGVRPSLMVRDEDYRHSFLHGNYVTLDNLTEEDFQRIIHMRLSPLYVSVHTTDPDLRRRMLRGRHAGELIARMERLLAGGIQMYAQIVLVPGWNDGEHLKRSVFDLARYYPGVQSVAVVPVGLTDHRQGLVKLRRPLAEEMRSVIAECEQWRAEFTQRFGRGFVYPADEFFLASAAPIPAKDWYRGSCQEENGVGMAVEFIETFNGRLTELTQELERRCQQEDMPLKVVACTGGLGMEIFRRHLLGPLGTVGGLEFRPLECANTFFGTLVTTTGLLTSRCLTTALADVDLSETDALLLPGNCTNEDRMFLDDISLGEFAEQYPCLVEQGSYDIVADILNVARKIARAEPAAG